MSHILHFYHLVALDYVDVNGTGLIPKGFTCPNYDRQYYARGIDPVLQTGGLPNIGINAPAYTVNNMGGGPVTAAALGDLTAYLAGQYVRALKFRRMAHQLGALFTGKMPHASSFTPAGMTTKVYSPAIGGSDAAVVQKVHELLYGGPGFTPTVQNGSTSGRTHPLNGLPVSHSNPHPESLLGFIGKPADFWAWAGDTTGALSGVVGFPIGFSPEFLPPWAAAGAAASGPAAGLLGAGPWKHGGTFLFDTVAAAHCFPEYFWVGQGHGRYLAWGIFEGANPPLAATPDGRLLTRGRVHLSKNPRTAPASYAFEHVKADHEKCKEFTTNSFYYENLGINAGRHMWDGRTVGVPSGHSWLTANKPNAYSYAKCPRHLNNESVLTAADHPNNAYLPYEVGPLARLISNAVLVGGSVAFGSSGLTAAQAVTAVNNGQVSLYYPGILRDVDMVLSPPGAHTGLGIGVFPGRNGASNASASGSENLAAHLTWAGVQGPGGPIIAPGNATAAPVFYLAGGVPPAVVANLFHSDYAGGATLDRIAARTLETYYVGAQMLSWFNQLVPPAAGTGAKKSTDLDYNPAYPYDANWPAYTRKFYDGTKAAPLKAQGAGLTEAPRGALGHWIRVYKGKVYNYQIITPTTWNINPKDAVSPAEKTLGQHGPIEQCIMGTPLVTEAEPLEILRIIHSFDPCCACTVHVMDVKKEKRFKTTLEAL